MGPGLRQRLSQVAARLTPVDGESLSGKSVDQMASVRFEDGDSLHLVIKIATVRLEGAATYGLDEKDWPLVLAFMRGLSRASPFKFDYPGLDTTATVWDGQLLIQNDIGRTDAHVLVLRVDGLRTSLTYAEVHRQWLSFFRELLAAFDVAWTQSTPGA